MVAQAKDVQKFASKQTNKKGFDFCRILKTPEVKQLNEARFKKGYIYTPREHLVNSPLSKCSQRLKVTRRSAHMKQNKEK